MKNAVRICWWILFAAFVLACLTSLLGCNEPVKYYDRCECRTHACHYRSFEDIDVTFQVDGKTFTVPLSIPYTRPAVIWKVTSDRVDYCLTKPKKSQSSDVCPFYWIESVNLPERTSNEITEIEGLIPVYLPDSEATKKKLEVYNSRCRAPCNFHDDDRRHEGT